VASSTFRSLHQGPTLLLLPNAWDAGTARLIESLGAKAIATTSAGLAWSRGYPDGNALAVERLVAATREIARVVHVPLSIDVEGGYSDDPAAVTHLVTSIIDAGVAGINIEDGAGTPDLLCAKIEAVKQRAESMGVDLFVNVRTDVYLRNIAADEAAVEEVIRRAAHYRSAGCDGLFVPGLAQGVAIAAIAGAINPLPLNIMLVPGLPSVEVLYEQGVRRLSAGAAIAEAALGCVNQLAAHFLAGSGQAIFSSPMVDYGAMNRLLGK
jgi:2-methylisocitrate lyase-like PEP mutase family enzyme